jgi:hypothetical protein
MAFAFSVHGLSLVTQKDFLYVQKERCRKRCEHNHLSKNILTSPVCVGF